MKLAKLLKEEAGDNLETIVKIDKMPEYKVLNPTEEEKEEAQDGKKASLPAEVTDNPKEPKEEKETDKSGKLQASKDLMVKLLASIQEFIKQI